MQEKTKQLSIRGEIALRPARTIIAPFLIDLEETGYFNVRAKHVSLNPW
jgi:hypothetical protein